MRVRVASYGSNEQDIADLVPVGNTLVKLNNTNITFIVHMVKSSKEQRIWRTVTIIPENIWTPRQDSTISERGT